MEPSRTRLIHTPSQPLDHRQEGRGDQTSCPLKVIFARFQHFPRGIHRAHTPPMVSCACLPLQPGGALCRSWCIPYLPSIYPARLSERKTPMNARSKAVIATTLMLALTLVVLASGALARTSTVAGCNDAAQ